MSQMNVGRATIEIVAENEDLKRKLAESEAQIAKLESGNTKFATNFVDGIKKSIAAVTSFIASLTAALGIAKLFYEIGEKIGLVFASAFDTAANKAKKFSDSILEADTQKRYDIILKKIEETTIALDKARESESSYLFMTKELIQGLLLGRSSSVVDDIQEELAALQNSAKDERETLASIRKRAHDEAMARIEQQRAAAIKAVNDRWEEDLRLFFENEKAKEEAEEEALREEYARAVDDEMRHREWLKEQAEKAHQEELDRIAEREKATMDSLKKIADEMARIRREQESGFGLGNIIFAGTGNPARDAMLRARIGRGNGRF